MNIEQLKQELFERLIAACDEIDTLDENKSFIVETVYAVSSRYDVEKFKDGNIPAGGKLLKNLPDHDAYTYGLDSRNRPCYSCFENTFSKRIWEGFYKYSDTLIEYIEFDRKSEKPNQMTRLHLENGRRRAVQYLKVNGGGIGKTYEGLGNKEIVEKLVESKHDLLCRIELYQYDENRISIADCWSMLPGIEPRYYKQIYTYDDSGNLKEIKQCFENGTSQYAFVEQPLELSFQELSDLVASQIAYAIGESIMLIDSESAIAIMQLNYHEVGNYEPYVTFMTDADQKAVLENSPKDDLLEKLFMIGGQELKIDSSKFERLLTAFMGKVEESENFTLATNMIRKVAKLLTTQKASGKLNLSDDFIAFAVDWSLIPDDLPQMMLECGMTPERLKFWQSRGVLLPDE